MVIKLLLKIACMAVIVGSADAKEVDLKIGVLHFPPFYVVSEKDGVSGIYTNILEKVLNKAGYSYSIDGFPPKRFYTQLGDNTTNLFLGVKGSKLIEGKVEFGELRFEGIQLRAYSTNKNNVITKKEELIGKKLIVIRAFGYGGLATYLKNPENNIQLIETTDHYTAFKMLAANRGDYLLDYRATSTLVMDKLNLTDVHYGVLSQANTYFIINKKHPNYKDVLRKLEAVYLDLVEEGEIDDIRVLKP